jgi:ATP-dependent DNA helicase RecG
MPVNDPRALLRRLLREPGESEWIEFKHNNADIQEIGRCVSACANAAMLIERDRAFIVFGVQDRTKRRLGTSVRLRELRNGGEDFINWMNRVIEPRLWMEFLDFDDNGLDFSILSIEPSYDRPIRFRGIEYIRVGQNVRKLTEFPTHERSLWLATARRKFEDAAAATHQTREQILSTIDVDAYYSLTDEEKPRNRADILRHFATMGFLQEDMEGRYDVTNLGAILFAKDIDNFPSIKNKSVRVVIYTGRDKRYSQGEIEGRKGYAVGFSGLIRYIMQHVPGEEKIINAIRTQVPICPEIAIRETVANALIHQDFTISGAGPIVEIYSDRIEITNPGDSLIAIDRILDERRSRNEKLAASMRSLGMCEERGGGLDRTMIEIENLFSPAPEFISAANSMRVVLFGPRTFGAMSKRERQRSCFYHCALRWITHDYMSNASLRERFSLPQEDYQAVSTVISEAVREGRISPADPNQGKRNARYVPYWAAETRDDRI